MLDLKYDTKLSANQKQQTHRTASWLPGEGTGGGMEWEAGVSIRQLLYTE